MTTWDGKERRNVNQWQSEAIIEKLGELDKTLTLIGAKLEALSVTVASHNGDLKARVDKHDEMLHGNGKEGIVTIVSNLKNDFKTHDENDEWFHRGAITIGVAIIAFLVKIVFFK